MAVTITDVSPTPAPGDTAPSAYTEWKIELGANNDYAQIDCRTLDVFRGLIWERSHATQVEVSYTIRSASFDASNQSTTGWHAHPSSDLIQHETAPLVGLRFKRTGSSGSDVRIRTTSGHAPIEVTVS